MTAGLEPHFLHVATPQIKKTRGLFYLIISEHYLMDRIGANPEPRGVTVDRGKAPYLQISHLHANGSEGSCPCRKTQVK